MKVKAIVTKWNSPHYEVWLGNPMEWGSMRLATLRGFGAKAQAVRLAGGWNAGGWNAGGWRRERAMREAGL